MGIRISKDIGYYVSKKNIQSLFVSDYKEILEDLDAEDTKATLFKETVLNLMNTHANTSTALDREVEHSMFYHYIQTFQTMDWTPYKLIKEVYNFDTNHGVLIRTPELVNKSHYDDDIDHYESNGYKFKSKLLHQSIYPCSGFIFKGSEDPKILNKLNHYLNKPIQKGAVIQGNIINSLLYILYGKTFDGQKFYKQVVATGAFHPNVEPLAWVIAKASGILLDSVDEIQFRTTMEPSIITTWG